MGKKAVPARTVYGTYPREQYSRGGAWLQLHRDFPTVPSSHWRKKHGEHEWSWHSVPVCTYRKCPFCQGRTS